MWTVAMVGGDADGVWRSELLDADGTQQGESAKLPVNSRALQHCTHDWEQMSTESVNMLTELNIGLGMSDMKTGKLKSELS